MALGMMVDNTAPFSIPYEVKCAAFDSKFMIRGLPAAAWSKYPIFLRLGPSDQYKSSNHRWQLLKVGNDKWHTGAYVNN